jgi:hypothetical protein
MSVDASAKCDFARIIAERGEAIRELVRVS